MDRLKTIGDQIKADLAKAITGSGIQPGVLTDTEALAGLLDSVLGGAAVSSQEQISDDSGNVLFMLGISTLDGEHVLG